MNADTKTTEPSTAVAQSEQPQVPAVRRAPIMAGGTVQAVVPKSIEEIWRVAGMISSADMAPKSYKLDQNAIAVGIMHGMEVGFTPMAALQSIAVINGMPSIWGDGALALIEASGLLEDKKEWLDTDKNGGLVAHCHMKRRGRPTWTEQQFSWEDAKIAKLVGKDTYQQYGKRMLQRRARAWAMTDGFSDVLRGLHIREVTDAGELEEQSDGSYAPKVSAPRPTRQIAPQPAHEEAEEGEAELNSQFRETMREDGPAKATSATKSENRADPSTGEISDTDAPNPISFTKADAIKFGPQIKKAILGLDSLPMAEKFELEHADALAAIKDHLPTLHTEIVEMLAARTSHLKGKK